MSNPLNLQKLNGSTVQLASDSNAKKSLSLWGVLKDGVWHYQVLLIDRNTFEQTMENFTTVLDEAIKTYNDLNALL